MKLSFLPRRGFLIAATVVGLTTAVACSELGPVSLATMMIYLPGNDTVLVDIESGAVESGPIEMFGTVDFSTEFFANDGTPDSRITEVNYRLDVTPANPALVTFTRVTQFAGTLNKVAGGGSTEIAFALFSLETQEYLFDWSVPVTIN